MTRRRPSPGFLTPGPDRIRAGPLIVRCRGALVEDPARIDDWDYHAGVTVQRTIAVALDDVISDINVGRGSQLAVGLSWYATATNLRGAGTPVILTDDGEVSVELELPGPLLGGTLVVTTQLCLGSAERPGPLSPRRPGSRLWTDTASVQLEGDGARFPSVALSFASAGIAAGRNGTWALSVSGDLGTPATSALVLYLNTDQPAVLEMLSLPDTPDAQRLLRFIRYDVTRQLVCLLLDDDDVESFDGAGDPGSLGDTLTTLVRRLFAGRTLDDLRSDREAAPGEFDAQVQALVPPVAGTTAR